MKKIILAFSAITAMVSAAFAQAVPNSSFENWAIDTNHVSYPPYIPADTFTSNEPADWTSSNIVTGSHVFGQKIFVAQSNDAYEGTSAVELKVDTITVAAFGVQLAMPGFVVNGRFPIDLSQFTSSSIDLTSLPGAGMPVSGRKEKIRGFYKYAPVTAGADSAAAIAILKKGSTVVAKAEFFASAAASTYTPFEATFVYSSCEIPDTAVILLSASNPYLFQSLLGAAPVPTGSVALFDSISLLDTTAGFSIPPQAIADYDTTTTGTAITIPVTANDQECYGNPITAALAGTTSARGGSLVLSGNSITYTPTIAAGKDSFYYTISAVTGTDTGIVRIIVTPVSGIRNIENIAVSVYPNPAQNVLNIAVDAKEVSKAVITNILGQTVAVKEISTDKTVVNTSSLENGLYVLTLFNANDKAVYAAKFVEAK